MAGREPPKSAPLYLACPYCKRSRFKTVEAVNMHIARSHDGEGPQVRLPKFQYAVIGAPKIVGYTGREDAKEPSGKIRLEIRSTIPQRHT